MEPFTLLHKKGLSMRFQVPINSTFSQKAIFLNSEYLKDSLLPYNIVCIRNPFFIIIRFFYILVYHRNKHVQINVFYYFFFSFRISSASGSYPGAITPSDTSLLISFAVSTSQTSESEIKSPKDDIRSAPLALA